MPRISWHDLPTTARAAAAVHTGTVRTARSAGTGVNSGIAAVIDTEGGPFFVKGVPVDHSQACTQQREADINPHLPPGSPRLLWRVRAAGWDLLGFELLHGRTADFSPGSPDLPKVVHALARLARTPCPSIPLKDLAQRWAPYTDPAALHLLRGEHLLHTDMAPHNVFVDDHDAHLIDWAWPTRGPAWIDPAVWVLRLLEAGHSPEQADGWAVRLPAWRAAPAAAVAAFADANVALWAELAMQDPERTWKADLAAYAATWADFVRTARPARAPSIHDRYSGLDEHRVRRAGQPDSRTPGPVARRRPLGRGLRSR